MIGKARAELGGLPILNLLIGSFFEAVGLELQELKPGLTTSPHLGLGQFIADVLISRVLGN